MVVVFGNSADGDLGDDGGCAGGHDGGGGGCIF